MHVTVFGATGKIGRLVVGQLIADGHQVVAFARNPGKLDPAGPGLGPGLTVIAGELSDTAAVTRAVAGSDTVISALGPSLKRSVPAGPLAAGTRAVVAAMDAARVSRFIGLAPSPAPAWTTPSPASPTPPTSPPPAASAPGSSAATRPDRP
jgi:uncharacterized protein YbjT (DUF2867 family)